MMCIVWISLALAVPEIPYDGLDQNGDGLDWVDVDGDGFASVLAGGGDCNDRDPRVHPYAMDWRGDGIDRDCDGLDGMVDGLVGRLRHWAGGGWNRFGEGLGGCLFLGLLGWLAAPFSSVRSPSNRGVTRQRAS